jgi:hypothetical protein
MPFFEARERAAQQCAVCGVLNEAPSTDSRVVLSRPTVPAEQSLGCAALTPRLPVLVQVCAAERRLRLPGRRQRLRQGQREVEMLQLLARYQVRSFDPDRS